MEKTVGSTAVLIPCYNEALTITKVVGDFQRELPDATIYVFDNNSTDGTADLARAAGAVVLREPWQGKGYVVASMFEKVDADYYVMVDGDDTYEVERARTLLAPVIAGEADMVVGARLAHFGDESFRHLHVLGNNMVRWLVNKIFGTHLTDIMSGYRAFNREVVRRIPLVSAGFEIETEMTIQMLYYRRRILEIQTVYRGRPEGSYSKLNTFRDGFRVLWKIFTLFRAFKPLTFFGSVAILFFLLGLLAGIPPLYDYFSDPNHYVRHVPLAILATGLMILSAGCVFLGVLVHAINWRIMELQNLLVRRRQ